MKHRMILAFATALGFALSCGCVSAQATKVPRVGFLIPGAPSLPVVGAFREEMVRLGYVDGKTVTLEERFAQGNPARLPELAEELVRLDVDVIVVFGAVAVDAARKATQTRPIVAGAVVDLVAMGIVDSLQRPNGNVTGASTFDPQQPTKQFEMLKELMPALSRVAILSDENIPRPSPLPALNAFEKSNDAAARSLGIEPHWVHIKGPKPDLDSAFQAMGEGRAEALLVLEVPVTLQNIKAIADATVKYKLPAMFPGGTSAAGGAITYGTQILDTVPGVASQVDRILKGAKVAEVPVELVNRREFIINTKAARESGLEIPSHIMKRADRVVQ